jgi:hypothetical protein
MADRMRGSLLAQRKPLDWWRIDASRVLRIGGRLLFVEHGRASKSALRARRTALIRSGTVCPVAVDRVNYTIFTGEWEIGRIFETRLTRQRSTSAESQRAILWKGRVGLPAPRRRPAHSARRQKPPKRGLLPDQCFDLARLVL